MLNTGLGNVILIAGAVAAMIKRAYLLEIKDLITEQFGQNTLLIPAAVTAVILMILSMDCISASSVSTEGKNIVILQSLPVEPYDVIRVKVRFHFILNSIPSLICCAILGFVLGLDVLTVLLMLVCVAVYVMFSANEGVWLNLRHPNMNWTNEAVPIKQSFPVFISLFGGFIIAALIGAGGFFLGFFLNAYVYFPVLTVLFAVLSLLIGRWLRRRGREIFAEL